MEYRDISRSQILKQNEFYFREISGIFFRVDLKGLIKDFFNSGMPKSVSFVSF